MDNENYVDPYIQAYRDSLQEQYNTAFNNIENQRTQDFANIMSQANKAGMLYSNFPERSKVQYDTGTYYPAIVKARNTYQTGLDTIRNKGVELANQVRTLEEKIADLNSMYTD